VEKDCSLPCCSTPTERTMRHFIRPSLAIVILHPSSSEHPRQFPDSIIPTFVFIYLAISKPTTNPVRPTKPSGEREENMLLLVCTMAFGQGKVINKQAGACLPVFSLAISSTSSSIEAQRRQKRLTGKLAENTPLRT